jgi:hypothetical protein
MLVVHVRAPGANDAAALERLQKAAKTARAAWKVIEATDPAAALVSAAGGLDAIAVESARGKHRLFTPASFALRLLRAGARELLVLGPH